jgi:hypothetical protein
MRAASSLQDVVAGDGTTSVVVICGALLKKAQELLERGIHPTVISDSFNKAANKACEVRLGSARAGTGAAGWRGVAPVQAPVATCCAGPAVC